MIHNIDFRPGRITFDDLSLLDIETSLLDQAIDLKQDMLQVGFPGAYLIDVGWYPHEWPDASEIANCFFWVRIIQKSDWETPVFSKKCKQLVDLVKTLEESTAIVRELLSKP